jgi:SAM-dependent methyltransferase
MLNKTAVRWAMRKYRSVMRFFDGILQNWSTRVVRSWIPIGARVLDIGCHHGEFLRSLGDSIGPSVGLDPRAVAETNARFCLVPEEFREPAPFPDASFDIVVLLATLGQIREKEALARECYRLLRPGGRVIVTVPSRWMGSILMLLGRFGLVDGRMVTVPHRYDPRTCPPLFVQHHFALEMWRRFQLGLNHLFVFRKPLPSTMEAPQADAVPKLRESLARA